MAADRKVSKPTAPAQPSRAPIFRPSKLDKQYAKACDRYNRGLFKAGPDEAYLMPAEIDPHVH